MQRLARHSDIKLTMKYGKPKSDEARAVETLPYSGATEYSTEYKRE